MGSVSSPDLVAAVAEAGGVGSVTVMGMSPSYLTRLLDDITARTSGVVAVNFLTADVDPDLVALAASRVRLVDFFWSDPNESLIEIAHRAGAVVSWQVGSVPEARAAQDAGADAVIAQGSDAGGHVRGTSGLLNLLPGVLDAVHVPVLAAGGIGHPRALAAVLAAGASGARIGTAFIATNESGAHPLYKQAVVDAGLGGSAITDVFSNQCPLCATSARHRVLTGCIEAARAAVDEEVGEITFGSKSFPLLRGSPLSPSTTTTGDIAAMVMYASDAAADVTCVRPAAQVLSWLCDGADDLLRR
jgi:nitronate monooxygenase